MYAVIVEGRFSATHQLRLRGGDLEPVHGHDWLVKAEVRSSQLNEQDMVVDFHHVESLLRKVLDSMQHKHLNAMAELASRNPTAEVVARHIFEAVRARGVVGLNRVEVTESPGCVAVYEAVGQG